MRNLCCSYDSVLSFPGLGNGNSGSRRPRISSSSCLLSPLLSPFLPSALSFQPSPCFTMVLSHLAMGSYLTKTSPRSFQCLPRSLLGCSFSNDQPPASFSDFSAGKGILVEEGPVLCIVQCLGASQPRFAAWYFLNFLILSLSHSPFYFCPQLVTHHIL